MKPGKLIKLRNDRRLFAADLEENQRPSNWPNLTGSNPGHQLFITSDEIVFLVDVKIPKKLATTAKQYGLVKPWLVLYNQKLWFIEAHYISFMDTTPFVDEDGLGWVPDTFFDC